MNSLNIIEPPLINAERYYESLNWWDYFVFYFQTNSTQESEAACGHGSSPILSRIRLNPHFNISCHASQAGGDAAFQTSIVFVHHWKVQGKIKDHYYVTNKQGIVFKSVCYRQNLGHYCSLNMWPETHPLRDIGQSVLFSAFLRPMLANGERYWNGVKKCIPIIGLVLSAEKGFKILPSSGTDIMRALFFKHPVHLLQVTNLPTVPPILVFLAKSPLVDQYDLSSLVDIRCAAAPVGKSTLEEVREIRTSIFFFFLLSF